MAHKPSPSLADKLAELVDKLLGKSVQPAPVYAPALVRRPQPARAPIDRR